MTKNDCKKIKILFLGTPKMSAFVLENLILAGYNVIGILSQPNKEKDRKDDLLWKMKE